MMKQMMLLAKIGHNKFCSNWHIDYGIHCCADELCGAHKQAWFNLLEKVSEHTNTSVMTLISVLSEVENRIGDLFF